MGAKRLVTMGLTALILLGVWAIYLVPVASVLDVGFGQSGFRNYDPYVYVLVSSVHRTSAGVGFDTYASDVLSCLPEGSSASLVTAGGRSVDVVGRIDSEVDTEQSWIFRVPKGDTPVRLLVRVGGAEHEWSLSSGSRYESTPWWYRVAPAWSKRSLARRVGLGV